MQSRAILFGSVWYGNYLCAEWNSRNKKEKKTTKNTVRHWNRKLHYFKRLKQNYCWTRICGTKSGIVIRLNLWLRSKWMFRSRIHKTCNNNLNFVVPLRRAQRKWFKSYGKIPARIEVKQHVLLLELMKNRPKIRYHRNNIWKLCNWTQQYTLVFCRHQKLDQQFQTEWKTLLSANSNLVSVVFSARPFFFHF